MGKLRQNPKETAAPGVSNLWIYNPWLDLIVGCGAWSAPLLLVSYFALASSARTWSVVFYALALFFNYPHYMATIYRAYHRAKIRKISHFHRAHYGADLADVDALALLATAFALDLHHLFDVEPVALQRTELRPVHDVRAPRRSRS